MVRFDCKARLVEALGLEWHGWHEFRRGIGSNLYGFGANDKLVQLILRHAEPNVTKERYIKASDPAVLAAMKSTEASLDMLNDCSASGLSNCGKLLKARRGEVAERLNAAVC